MMYGPVTVKEYIAEAPPEEKTWKSESCIIGYEWFV